MDTDHNIVKTRSNKTATIVITAAAALIIGLAIGVTAAESGHGILSTKSTSSADTNQLSSSSNSPQSTGAEEWNPFQEIRNMQAQMDRMFNRMNQQFMGQATIHGFTDVPGYSLSLDVRDLKDRYEVHAYLPDAKSSDVNVSVENGRTLDVKVNSQRTESSGGKNMAANISELGQYEQTIQLPTQVKADQMKISRKDHELIITIPKAS